MKRLFFVVACLSGTLLVFGIGFEQWARWRAPRANPPPGQLIDVAGKVLHLHCKGEGSPTVILEAGGGSPSAVWYPLQEIVSQMSRVCSYDRAGYAWSERRTGPRDARHIVDELRDLMRAASISPPYVLVGHSLGGPLTMVFTHRYPAEVEGLVLVDPSVPEQREWEFPDSPSAGPVMLLIRFAAATGILRLLLQNASPPGFPAEVMALARAFGPSHLATAMEEMKSIDQTLEQAAQLTSFGDRPLIVISAGQLPDAVLNGLDRAVYSQSRARFLTAHEALASHSSQAEHRVNPKAGHFVQLDDPESVAAAIADVMNRMRTVDSW